MIYLVNLLFALSILGIGWSIAGMFRNVQVFKYRIKILKAVHLACQADIDSGHPWEWRHEEFDKVSYNEMAIKLWKPLNSFWEDKSFIDPKAAGPRLRRNNV